jgi:hypothetical protein
MPPSTTSARQLRESGKGVELTCSRVTTVCQLQKETLTMVGYDVL